MNITERANKICELITEQIIADIASHNSECSYPVHSADDSEAKIASLNQRIASLRDIRTRVEDSMIS